MIIFSDCLKYVLNRESKPVHSRQVSTSWHGFQTLLSICERFGCKLWLLSKKNYARDRFQLFAHRHLKWLCYSMVAIEKELCQRSFPTLCAPPSEVALLFNGNLSRHPFLRHVVNLVFCLLSAGFHSHHAPMPF